MVQEVLDPLMTEEAAAGYATTIAARAEDLAIELIPQLLNIILEVSIGVLVLASFLYAALVASGDLMRWLREMLPVTADREERLFAEIGRGIHAVVYGLVVVALVQATLGGLVWWALGLPNPIFWSVVMFVLSMVPALGPFFVFAPAAIWAFLQGDTTQGIILWVAGVFMVGAVDNVLRPWLVGRRGGIPAPLVLLSVVGGLVAIGPFGVLLGPLVVAVFLQVAKLARETRADAGAVRLDGNPARGWAEAGPEGPGNHHRADEEN